MNFNVLLCPEGPRRPQKTPKSLFKSSQKLSKLLRDMLRDLLFTPKTPEDLPKAAPSAEYFEPVS